MARPTTKGSALLGPKTVTAFLVGAGLGLALVAPVLPEVAGDAFMAMLSGGGTVIAIGVVTLAVLMALLAVFYQFYLG